MSPDDHTQLLSGEVVLPARAVALVCYVPGLLYSLDGFPTAQTGSHQIVPDGLTASKSSRWPWMAPDGFAARTRWHQMAQMALDGTRWPQMAARWPRWFQIAKDDSRWHQMLQNASNVIGPPQILICSLSSGVSDSKKFGECFRLLQMDQISPDGFI